MNKSPGHQKWPEHKVQDSPMERRITVEIAGQRVADSTHVVRVDEDQHPVRYYFPRSDVKMELLEPSSTVTKCPFKGTAHYFNVKLGDKKLEDAVWTYEDPYEEHADLQDRVAFYDDKLPDIHVQVGA